ncbi:ABC transporter ATP-binding protein/permease [Aerococcaceae bacterium INB8]|uniref:ABC transporter ATP-binding protein/permease n=1 Tax=Ruoffia halotolerans TaxID=2748684 RepID=A0A839A7J2_9LACT|nr:ABC transporter ATP-binding protein/permease [Ruoffia halotolerans]MBA5729698.1 ABC transporter ATP-binding protein/permease [Ruoffia halotolerans]
MLELQNLKKVYKVGNTVTKALDDVSVAFRQKEFVAILGPSGSGKTTFLNVVGGLDRYDSGDMIINGQSTKSFKDTDWDAYRNNSIGFVFQSYNLISHLGITDNVELGMTLSGVSKEEKRQKAEDALRRVGLGDHLNKKPNQLSGGQMQRVAIARALANDPDILLCDEPTGALDSDTGIQIMELIQELSLEKLVIMVTHNPELAENYANRIIEFSDGQMVGDSNPYDNTVEADKLNLKRTKMSYFTALSLSFKNIWTKKGRTFLTAFASSIGIIGIAVVLSLSNGFQKQIDQTQAETLAQFPITISQIAQDTSAENLTNIEDSDEPFPKTSEVVANVDPRENFQHINPIDEEFIDYVENIDPALSQHINYARSTQLNLMREIDGEPQMVQFSNVDSENQTTGDMMNMVSSMTGVGVSTFPHNLDSGNNTFLQDNYDVLSGNYPANENEVVLIVDENNEANLHGLNNLGFEVEEGDAIPFEDIVGTKIALVYNNAYYEELLTGNYVPNQDLEEVYNNDSNEIITVSGVLRIKEDSPMDLLAPGIAYSDLLAQKVVNENQKSDVVQAQEDSDVNVMTNEPIEGESKDQVMTFLGANEIPNTIMIYPNNFEAKDEVLAYLDEFNEGKANEDKIIYSDLAGTMTELTGGLMDAITYVLIAFAAISLITSMIMISIITYTSVLERTKEIGVLKALGARKKDITRVFDAETLILGVFSGVIGIVVAYLLTSPINSMIESLTELSNVAQLDPVHAIVLVIISTILTVLGGHIPAKMAANKDAAIALRAD